jgi:predicted TIM-barrel fold metal-dependent hydrolase
MDHDGVHTHTLLPHVIGFAGERLRFLGDARRWGAAVRTYNDFLLTGFCAAAPGRLVGVGLLPLYDPHAAASEVGRAVGLGARAVSFPHAPSQLGLPPLADEAWAPVFSAVEDAGVPLFVHVGASGGPPSIRGVAAPGSLLTLTALDVVGAMVDLLFSYVLVRHPRLRVVLLEGGVGWLPYATERIAFFCGKRPEVWAPPEGPGSRRPPLEHLRQQIAASFIDDPVGMRLLDDIGIERVLWQCDYPHADSSFPDSRAHLTRQLAEVPDDDARAVAGGTASRLLEL